MKSLIFALLLVPALASASQLEWEWNGDESHISEFRLYKDGEEHYIIADPAARSAESDPMELVPGASYTLRACNPAACSEDSNELWIPRTPSSVKLIITF